MKDQLGDRMKSQYEDRTRYMLPRRTYTIIRLDGKAFHTYTKKLRKPFDIGLVRDIDNAVAQILPEIQGAVFAYVQSDEISILVTDFALPTTCAWFDNNVQKIVSVTASLMTARFNQLRLRRALTTGIPDNVTRYLEVTDSFIPASFDCRVFTIPDPVEVYNYFVWRNQDAARNSISMFAQSIFSHKSLQKKNQRELIQMLEELGHFLPAPEYRYGRLIVNNVDLSKTWCPVDAWKFQEKPGLLQERIPGFPRPIELPKMDSSEEVEKQVETTLNQVV